MPTARTDAPCADATRRQPAERRYTNHLRVGFNRLEFLLDFAQAYDDGGGELVHAQLVAAPAKAKAFTLLMQGCIADFEARFGVIDTEAPAARTD